MKVLDLFSGLCGWSSAFKQRGHTVYTIDFDSKFKPDLVADIGKLSVSDLPYTDFDVVLASPPCNCFSVASISKHWLKGNPPRPKDKETKDSIKLIGHTVKLIMDINPKYWILENPRGMLRNVLGKPSVTTFFCNYGEFVLKPTDLYGVLPPMQFSSPLKWEKASRGSKSGVQGIKTPEERAKIPYALSEAVCVAIEKEFAKNEKDND